MRLGLTPPVVSRLPGRTSAWELDAGPAELVAIAEAADQLGYYHITCSEHVAIPVAVGPVRGATYWDPLATLGYLAAKTQHLRLVTNVLVLAYHHPLAIAKRYGTLDRLSNGRVVLGLGVGSLVEEFELLGAPFADRGARADDALRALRAALGQREPSYSGPYYSFEGMIVDPWAVQERMPMWMGGRTRRSLRRAASLAEGWMPFALTTEECAAMLATVDLPPGFEVVLTPDKALDPLARPEETAAQLRAVADAGATIVSVRPVHESLQHYLDQLAAFSELAEGSSSTGGAG